jgi:hypothetical protein
MALNRVVKSALEVLVKMVNGSLRDVAGEPMTSLVALTKCSNKGLKLTPKHFVNAFSVPELATDNLSTWGYKYPLLDHFYVGKTLEHRKAKT